MRIINELIDGEIFIDAILEKEEIDELHEQSIEPIQVEVNGVTINLWVRTATMRELYEEWDEG